MPFFRSGPWSRPGFPTLWFGTTISEIGSQVTLFALPLTAALVLHAGPAQMGALEATSAVPWLVASLFAGAFVDRVQRRPVLIVANVVQAALVGSIPLAALLGHLTLAQIYLVSLLAGTGAVFVEVAGAAFFPLLVGRENLVAANGIMSASASAAGMIGPGLAGVLVQVLSPPLAILLDAISFAVASTCVTRIRLGEPVPDARDRRLLRDIGTGLRFVLRHPIVRVLAIGSGISNLTGGMFGAVYILFMIRNLHLPPVALGGFEVVRYAGFFLGAIAASAIARRMGIGRAVATSPLVLGFGWLLVPLAGFVPSIALALMVGANVCAGLGNTLYNVNATSLRQALTPDSLLGRSQAAVRFLARGGLPFGALAGGALGEVIGLQATLFVAVAGMIAGEVYVLCSPVRQIRKVPSM